MDAVSGLDVESCLRSIGKWLYLQNFELVYEWRGEKKDLVNKILEKSNGKGRSGTNTSVSEALRLRNAEAACETLDLLSKSESFLRDHPEAIEMIRGTRARHPELVNCNG